MVNSAGALGSKNDEDGADYGGMLPRHGTGSDQDNSRVCDGSVTARYRRPTRRSSSQQGCSYLAVFRC